MPAIIADDPAWAGSVVASASPRGGSGMADVPLEFSRTFAAVFHGIAKVGDEEGVDAEAAAGAKPAIPADSDTRDESGHLRDSEYPLAAAVVRVSSLPPPAPPVNDAPQPFAQTVSGTGAKGPVELGETAAIPLAARTDAPHAGFEAVADLDATGRSEPLPAQTHKTLVQAVATPARTGVLVPAQSKAVQPLGPEMSEDDRGGSDRPVNPATDVRHRAPSHLVSSPTLEPDWSRARHGAPALVGSHDLDPKSDAHIAPSRGVVSGTGASELRGVGIRGHPAPPLPNPVMRDAFSPGLSAVQPIETAPQPEMAMSDMIELHEWRVSVSTGTQAAHQPQMATSRPDVTPGLAPQIVAAVQSRESGTSAITLQLAPEELGRVSLRLTNQDGILTVNVLAERPETLELLRRHVESLARGLLEAGYQETRFSFAGQHREEGTGKPPTARAMPQPDKNDLEPGNYPVEPLAVAAPATPGTRINVLI